IGRHSLSFGPLVLGRTPEWDFDPARVEELRHLSRLSGGEERLDLSQVWLAPRRATFTSLQPPLLITLPLLILAEILHTRLGARWTKFRRHRANDETKSSRIPKKKSRKQKLPTPPPPEEKAAKPQPPSPVPEETATRRDRFNRAKRRGL